MPGPSTLSTSTDGMIPAGGAANPGGRMTECDILRGTVGPSEESGAVIPNVNEAAMSGFADSDRRLIEQDVDKLRKIRKGIRLMFVDCALRLLEYNQLDWTGNRANRFRCRDTIADAILNGATMPCPHGQIIFPSTSSSPCPQSAMSLRASPRLLTAPHCLHLPCSPSLSSVRGPRGIRLRGGVQVQD